MTYSPSPKIAIFGATGGCTLPVLVKSIEAGYTVSALVRTPSKLTALLSDRGTAESVIASQLTIHAGNAKDPAAVQQALLIDDHIADLIILGVGGAFQMSRGLMFDDPQVCASCARAIVTALEELKKLDKTTASGARPQLCAISTTGISKQRDIPLAMVPLYHWMLKTPHADKKAMEEVLQSATNGEQGVISGLVLVKPSLLVDGKQTGTAKVRVGWEDEHGPEHVAIGYTITRDSVGSWIFEDFVADEEKRRIWIGKMVSLTY